MVNPEDRRRTPRYVSEVPAHYRLLPFDGSPPLDAVTEDLSLEGVRFRCPAGLRPRSGMLFELLVPGEQAVRSFGRAAWVQPLPYHVGYEVGVRFEDQSTATRRLIARHLEHRAAAPAA